MRTTQTDLSKLSAIPALLTVADVSQVFRCAEAHVRRLVHLGLLEATRIGCGLRISPVAVETFLREHRAQGPDPRRDPRRNRQRNSQGR